MHKIKHYLSKIREKGLLFTFLFIVDTIWYKIYIPFYRFYLLHIKKVDNNKVFFMSLPDYSDNAKSLYRYLYKNIPDLHFVWMFSKDNILPPNTARTYFFHRDLKYRHGPSKEMWRQVTTSKYLFFTHGSPMHYIPKRKGQIIINLWHGCGYKAIEKNRISFIKENPFDYALVPGPIFIESKKEFWGCRKDQILAIGYPRYDEMLSNFGERSNFLKNIQANNQKLIIWMPTFRNTNTGNFPEENVKRQFDLPLLNSIEELRQLDQLCMELRIVLCIKRHPYQLRYSCESDVFNNIKFINNEDLVNAGIELYSFLRYTDALISDYSSVAIDYLLLDKPIAFCLEDFNDYKRTRGFIFDNPLEYMPGQYLYNLEDLQSFIIDVCEGNDKYKERRAEVRSVAQNPCNNYCKRIWDTVQRF